jgi:hypothetical protein
VCPTLPCAPLAIHLTVPGSAPATGAAVCVIRAATLNLVEVTSAGQDSCLGCDQTCDAVLLVPEHAAPCHRSATPAAQPSEHRMPLQSYNGRTVVLQVERDLQAALSSGWHRLLDAHALDQSLQSLQQQRCALQDSAGGPINSLALQRLLRETVCMLACMPAARLLRWSASFCSQRLHRTPPVSISTCPRCTAVPTIMCQVVGWSPAHPLPAAVTLLPTHACWALHTTATGATPNCMQSCICCMYQHVVPTCLGVDLVWGRLLIIQMCHCTPTPCQPPSPWPSGPVVSAASCRPTAAGHAAWLACWQNCQVSPPNHMHADGTSPHNGSNSRHDTVPPQPRTMACMWSVPAHPEMHTSQVHTSHRLHYGHRRL